MPITRKSISRFSFVAALLPTSQLLGVQPEETFSKDVGPLVCETVRQAMQTTEPEWHQKLNRGYQWWPHWFKQQVTADDKLEDKGVMLSKVRIESEILSDVSADEETYATLSRLNMAATTSALVYIPESGRIVSFCGVQTHEQNKSIASILAQIGTAIQVTDVAATANQIQESLGGTFLSSAPPHGNVRSTPDDMINFAELLVIPAGDTPSVYVGEECLRANREVGRWSLLTNAGEDGLTAEFEWEKGSEPTIIKLGRGDKDTMTETVLLCISADERHVRLGNGMKIILSLPLNVPEDRGPAIANRLNLAERSETKLGHQFGAWTYLPPKSLMDIDQFSNYPYEHNPNSQTGTLMHVAFLPNVAHFPGITSVLFQASAVRSRWAKSWIDANTKLRLNAKAN